MKIAVFGWYGHNNAGDERIKWCLNHFLLEQGGIQKVDFYDLHTSAIKGKTNKFDHYDLVIVGGGGLILSQCNYHDFIAGINTKLVTLGISIERPKLCGNTKKLALALLDKSIAVLVRDPNSAKKLLPYDHSKKIKISYDLTFLKPYENVKITEENTMGVNLLPKPFNFKYSTLNVPFFWFFLAQLTRLGIKNPIRIVDFKNMIDVLKTKFRLVPIPLYCAPQKHNLPIYQKNDIEFLKHYFHEVPFEFLDKAIDQCSVFLSMRLHGTIFAVQKGVPAISFSYLPKNRNFMQDVGLEDYVVESSEINRILKIIENITHKRCLIKDKMKTYSEKATKLVRADLIDILNIVS